MMCENVIQKQSLTFNALPSTVAQIANGNESIPTVRALIVRNRNSHSDDRGAYRNRGVYIRDAVSGGTELTSATT